MATPVSFPATTPHFALPLLFSGQAQKEFSLNQALVLIDSLMAQTIVASATTPPGDSVDGQVFRILPDAAGDWVGREGQIAIRVGGSWSFIEPQTGMTVFDQDKDAFLHFNGTWRSAAEPLQPVGGSTVDSELRVAFASLIQALRDVGIISGSD